MEKTTILVKRGTRNRLNRWKYELNCKDYDEVINKLLKLVNRLSLAQELKEEK